MEDEKEKKKNPRIIIIITYRKTRPPKGRVRQDCRLDL